MWAAMTLAMMLPTAGPMILTYAEIADTAARKGEPVVSPLVLTAGYVAVWLGFALAAARAADRAGARRPARRRQGSARAARRRDLLGAGLYQFSALKQCLPDALPAAVSVLLLELDDERAACSGSGCGRGFIASAAAGR